MLDLKLIREKPQQVQELLDRRGVGNYNLQPILELDKRSRELETSRSQVQARSNEIGKLMGQKMQSGSKPDDAEIKQLRAEGNQLKDQLAGQGDTEKEIKLEIEQLLLALPNLPSLSTPVGKDETANVEVKRWGDEFIPQRDGILPHWEIGEN